MGKLKTAANPRDAQRLSRLDSPHANAWLSARPSSLDGKDTILPPKIFRTMLQEVRRQNYEAQQPAEPRVQAR